jgi:hypothetical protein
MGENISIMGHVSLPHPVIANSHLLSFKLRGFFSNWKSYLIYFIL